MAARVLLRQRVAAPLSALAVGGYVLAPVVVYAEAPDSVQSRKSIYDDPDPPPTPDHSALVPAAPSPDAPEPRRRRPTPTDRLAVQIGRARHVLYGSAVRAEDAVNRAMDRAFHLEHSFTSTLASLAPPPESGERLLPGLVYVLVAGLAGSVLARGRGVLLRTAAPLALGVGAANVVLPVTTANAGQLARRYERRFPAVAKAHEDVSGSLEKGVSFTKAHARAGIRYVEGAVTGARETVEGWVRKGK